MARRSVLRWIAAACAVSLLAVVALVLCAPLWIDAGSVQAKVAQWVGEASGGHARFARVDLHYLPLPGIVLIEPGYSMLGMVEVAAKSGTIDLDFLALLRGRVQPRSVRLEHPTVRVSLPEPEPDPTPFSLKQTEDSLRKVVAAIADAAPDAVVEIVDGNLEFRIGSRAPLQARNVGIRFAVVDGTLEAHVSGTADLWQKLDATARLARDSLAGEGRIEIAGLALDRIGAIAGLGDQWPVERATVQGTLKWQMRGLVDAQAEASLTSPSLVVRAGKGRLDAQGAAIDATARIHGGVMSVTVGRASLETPRSRQRQTSSGAKLPATRWKRGPAIWTFPSCIPWRRASHRMSTGSHIHRQAWRRAPFSRCNSPVMRSRSMGWRNPPRCRPRERSPVSSSSCRPTISTCTR